MSGWAYTACWFRCFPNFLGIKVNNLAARGSRQPSLVRLFVLHCRKAYDSMSNTEPFWVPLSIVPGRGKGKHPIHILKFIYSVLESCIHHLYFFVSVCAHVVCVCTYVCRGMCTCVCVLTEARIWGWLSSTIALNLIFWDRVFHGLSWLTNGLDWLPRKLEITQTLPPTSGCRHAWPYSFVGARDPNSCLHCRHFTDWGFSLLYNF